MMEEAIGRKEFDDHKADCKDRCNEHEKETVEIHTELRVYRKLMWTIIGMLTGIGGLLIALLQK
jgi:translation initiation factor 1 (eIF-1/SUI1)